MYYQGSEFIGHEFRKSLIEEEDGITSKPSTPINPAYNEILERVYQVLGNLAWNYNIKDTYVDEDERWLGILAAEALAIFSTSNG